MQSAYLTNFILAVLCSCGGWMRKGRQPDSNLATRSTRCTSNGGNSASHATHSFFSMAAHAIVKSYTLRDAPRCDCPPLSSCCLSYSARQPSWAGPPPLSPTLGAGDPSRCDLCSSASELVFCVGTPLLSAAPAFTPFAVRLRLVPPPALPSAAPLCPCRPGRLWSRLHPTRAGRHDRFRSREGTKGGQDLLTQSLTSSGDTLSQRDQIGPNRSLNNKLPRPSSRMSPAHASRVQTRTALLQGQRDGFVQAASVDDLVVVGPQRKSTDVYLLSEE